MHKNLDSLYRYVDKEALPPEYGGLGKFEPELYDKYVKDNEAILTGKFEPIILRPRGKNRHRARHDKGGNILSS